MCSVRAMVAFVLSALACSALAVDLDFFKDIHPFLQPNCIPCHNKTTTKAKLNLETPELIKKGGESGPAAVPGKSLDSLIVQSAAHKGDSAMPPKDNKSGALDLTSEQIALLSLWIDQGAKDSLKQTEAIALHTLPRGIHPIYSVAMTNDGRHAACGRGGQLFLYDLASRETVSQLTDPSLKNGAAHDELVHSLHFSPDGNRLASGGFREVKIWRREQSAPVFQALPELPTGSPSALSPDGTRLLSAGTNTHFELRNASTGALLNVIPNSTAKGLKTLRFSPNGNSFAALFENGSWQLWPLQDAQTHLDSGTLAGARSLAWTPDGKHLLFCTTDTIQVWSLSEAKSVREIKVPSPLTCAVSDDGASLAIACADSVVRVFEFATGKLGLELQGPARNAYKLSKLEWDAARANLDATHYASVVARIDTQNKAFDVQEKKASEAIAAAKKELPEKQKAVLPAKKAREGAEKADDEAAAAITSAPEGKPDAALLAKKKESSTKLAAAITALTSAETAVIAAENHIKDGDEQLKIIAEARTQNTADRAKAEADQEAAKKGQAAAQTALDALKASKPKADLQPLAVCFSKNGQSIAAIFNDGRQQVWSAASGVSLGSLAFGTPLISASLASPANADFLSLGSDGRLAKTPARDRWTLERTLGGANPESPFVDRVCAVRFSPDGRTLATGGGESSRSGDIHLWDADSGKLLQSWKDKHNDTVLALDFSPDGAWLASGAADRLGRVTEVATRKPVFLLEAHTHHVMGVSFRADGRMLATAGADGFVNTWDMSSGERAKKIPGWNKEVTGVQYLGATNKMVTSAADNQVRIVAEDATEVRSMAKLPDFVQSAAGASYSPYIAGGGEDSVLRIWDGSSGKEIVLFPPPK
jgi:WD40 repeat protein